ncbi:14025_t:CDS:1, partial [Entrophospora sp. SA101]
ANPPLIAGYIDEIFAMVIAGIEGDDYNYTKISFEEYDLMHDGLTYQEHTTLNF